MDLIIKPTEACNFKCTFCSSTNITEDKSAVLDLEYVARFLDRYPGTRTIIVNGGDPLMMKPSYYWEILKLLEERGMSETIVSLTSNLWAFFKKPQMWTELFKHPQIGVTTSFQYGNARLKGDLTPFSESEFWQVSDLFLELVGYRPEFIAVITKENEDTVLDTVRLAKKMGVVCKINYALSSGTKVFFKGIEIGNAGSTYLLADIYEKYVEIYKAGLADWEFNTQQMIKTITQSGNTICPQSRTCDSGIRTIQPSGDYYSCGSFGDDKLFGIDFDKEMAGEFFTPLSEAHELLSLKDSCFTCPMFSICNGCRKTTHDLKSLGLVEQHCQKMKKVAVDIVALSGREDIVVTEYVKEN